MIVFLENASGNAKTLENAKPEEKPMSILKMGGDFAAVLGLFVAGYMLFMLG